jgi:hypothetical protein
VSEAVAAEGKNPTAYLEPGEGKRPFREGNPGKPKGALAKRTIQQREILELLDGGFDAKGGRRGLAPFIERVTVLLNSEDESIRLETEKFLKGFQWSRPKLTLEVEGSIDVQALVFAAFARAREIGNGNGAGRPR